MKNITVEGLILGFLLGWALNFFTGMHIKEQIIREQKVRGTLLCEKSGGDEYNWWDDTCIKKISEEKQEPIDFK